MSTQQTISGRGKRLLLTNIHVHVNLSVIAYTPIILMQQTVQHTLQQGHGEKMDFRVILEPWAHVALTGMVQ